MPNKTKVEPRPKSRKLSLCVLRTDPETFQPRSLGLDHGHVAGLVKALKDGKPLDPMRVLAMDDGSFTIIDGHHSLAAYLDVRWSKKVKVLAYTCTTAEAQQIAVAENSKSRLQMSFDDKADWAWKLTIEQPDLSRKKVAELCGVADRTVSNMRAVVAKLATSGEVELPSTWREALILKNGTKNVWTDEEQQEWDKATRAKLKERIAPDIARVSKNKPDLVMEVVQEIMGKDSFETGCDWLGFVERDEIDPDAIPF